jgi:hypothetical protein
VKFATHVDAELQGFCRYAANVCGLASATLVSRWQWIGRFLTDQFPKRSIKFSRLRPTHVRDFFTRQMRSIESGQNTSETTQSFAAWSISGSVLARSRPYVWMTSTGRPAR